MQFAKTTSKKSLVFHELICDLPHTMENTEAIDSLPNESLFLISMTDPWYKDIILYFQTLRYQPASNCDEHCRICHQAKNYLILNDTLYRCGIESIL